jgi:hypothetical protein
MSRGIRFFIYKNKMNVRKFLYKLEEKGEIGVIAVISLFTLALLTILIVAIARTKAFGPIPEKMKLESVNDLQNLVSHLEESIPAAYAEQVRKRVEAEHKLRKHEWEWRFYELKRFFVLCGILKEAPMFSMRVDDVWHEMIMFTREYERFSEAYVGRLLHHAPNVSGASNPDERGFFDWVYSVLFSVHPETRKLYGGFYRHPVSPSRIAEFQQLPADVLKARYFSNHIAAQEVIDDVILKMKRQAKEIAHISKAEIKARMKHESDSHERLLAFLYLSSYEYHNYRTYKKSSTSCSSCFSCSSDGGGSSCSSCGGGGD